MPELPEVEVVKLFLEDKLLGQKIINLEIVNPKSFIGNPKQVVGQSITKFTRIGKQLSIHLSNSLILLVHLKMTGQLILGDTMLGHPTKFDKYPNKSTRIVFTFENQTKLFFNDQRKFGWIRLFTKTEIVAAQSSLGHDIFDIKFTPGYIFDQLGRSRRPVKVTLLDQHFFAGIGNIYANDALFLSKINPTTPSNKITKPQSKLIHKYLIDIMHQSVLAGGSTMKDNKYIRPDGSYGSNQFFFRVYGRDKESCLNCQAKIKKIIIGGRGTFYCPDCQK